MRLLALDSAGNSSSAAIWADGAVRAQAIVSGGHHGEQLVALVDQCLESAGLELARLDAIACGRGPGAFTGVRLAIAVSQGLAFAAHLPIIPVSNLQATAERARRLAGAPARLLVCQDARMHEVYWAAFDAGPDGVRRVGPESVTGPAAVALPAAWSGPGEIWGAGSGFEAYREAFQPLARCLARCLALEGNAEHVAGIAARLGLGEAVEPERAAPVYLRDNVVASPGGTASRGS